LIADVDGDLASVTADGAYDTVAVYEAAAWRGAKVVVPTTVFQALTAYPGFNRSAPCDWR